MAIVKLTDGVYVNPANIAAVVKVGANDTRLEFIGHIEHFTKVPLPITDVVELLTSGDKQQGKHFTERV